MNTIELFCGIGGFRLAADRLGIQTVFANDCCENATEVYRSRFDAECLRFGNIQDFINDIPSHDMLTAGFPCQPFSAAGKKQGIRDPRGTLFEVIAKVLTNNRPRYFVLENVKRLLTMENGQHFATIIDTLSLLGYIVEWRLKNAYEFDLPQNRQRIIIVGRLEESCGAQVQAQLLGVEELCKANNLPKADIELWTPISVHGSSFPNWGIAARGKFTAADIPLPAPRTDLKLRNILQDKYEENVDMTEATLQRLRQNDAVNRFVQHVQILSNQDGGARMGYTIFGTDGLSPTLTASTSRHYERYKVGEIYRRLTSVEYARLQGFPDEHCSIVSPYTQYKLYGNALPPQLAEWAISRAISDEGVDLNNRAQLQLELAYV